MSDHNSIFIILHLHWKKKTWTNSVPPQSYVDFEHSNKTDLHLPENMVSLNCSYALLFNGLSRCDRMLRGKLLSGRMGEYRCNSRAFILSELIICNKCLLHRFTESLNDTL